nr:immunoglobulin heavy chain junction region [Mus musculus]
CARLETAYW